MWFPNQKRKKWHVQGRNGRLFDLLIDFKNPTKSKENGWDWVRLDEDESTLWFFFEHGGPRIGGQKLSEIGDFCVAVKAPSGRPSVIQLHESIDHQHVKLHISRFTVFLSTFWICSLLWLLISLFNGLIFLGYDGHFVAFTPKPAGFFTFLAGSSSISGSWPGGKTLSLKPFI